MLNILKTKLNILIVILFCTSISKAELIKPKESILLSEVVKIQITADYSELGILLIVVTLLTLILPILFVFIIKNSKYKTQEKSKNSLVISNYFAIKRYEKNFFSLRSL
jgi:hypothetical protein